MFVPWTERPPKPLWGVHPSVVQQLQDLQPFNRDVADRRRHPLWILAELSNADKHRYVPLVTVLADLVAIEFPDIYGESITARILWKREPGPIEDRTKVAVVRVEGHVPQRVFPLPPESFMKPKGTFDVAFASGAPGFGQPVISTLADLYLVVQMLLLQFEPVIKT